MTFFDFFYCFNLPSRSKFIPRLRKKMLKCLQKIKDAVKQYSPEIIAFHLHLVNHVQVNIFKMNIFLRIKMLLPNHRLTRILQFLYIIWNDVFLHNSSICNSSPFKFLICLSNFSLDSISYIH